MYEEVWDLQKSLQSALIAGEGEETLILCEHDPVITLGKSAVRANVLHSADELAARGVCVYEIERGGDVTWHGPGQLVGYPILDLNRHRRDVHWYMRSLEELLIGALGHYNISGVRVSGKTGVWVAAGRNEHEFSHFKIASMGVRLSRWVTLHGFSLNISDCSQGFSLINPCGFQSSEMTWMERECGHAVDPKEVERNVEQSFLDTFY